MDLARFIIVQNSIFVVMDVIICIKTLSKKIQTKTQRAFLTFAIETTLLQCSIIIAKICDFKMLGSIPEIPQYIIYSLLMIFLCLCACSWFKYFVLTLPEHKYSDSKVVKFVHYTPVIVMAIACIASPWTHWIFYVDEALHYERGTLFSLQTICPYLYFLGAIVVIIFHLCKGNRKKIRGPIKNFLSIILPSFAGAAMQIWIYSGGYTQIGVSFGLLLMYLNMYVEEIKENERLQSLADINKQLSDANNEILEQQVRDQLQLKTIAEAIHGGFKIGIADKNYSFRFVSKQLAKMLGYTVEEFMEASGGTMAGIVNVEEASSELPKAEKAIAEGHMYTMNYHMRCKDGTWKNVEDRGRKILSKSGEPEYWSFISDKDELVEKTKALELAETANRALEESKAALEKATQTAEAASRAKTSFLFNMSHDIRTPMNAIIGFTNLLYKYQDDEAKRSDYIKKIQDSSTLLLSIINNVLEMARIEKGTLELTETVWSVEQFNDTLYSVFNEMMAEKGIKFTQTVDIKNHYVYCDAIKIREILLNILSNSFKYTNEGGSVTMSLTEIPSDKEGWSIFQTRISDTGIGMSKEFLPHIFEEFTREKNTTAARIEGTGLGMSIVKRLLDFMDGTIDVQSEQGKGTTFIVTIPHRIADKSKVVEHAGIEIDPTLFKGKRILLAEDNELNSEIAITLLEEAGFKVDNAVNGKICVDMLDKAEPGYYDLILMDVQMPEMNGYEATKIIRTFDNIEKAQIPILAMTANAFQEDKIESIRSGMNGHLAKPIDVTEMLRQLAFVLAN